MVCNFCGSILEEIFTNQQFSIKHCKACKIALTDPPPNIPDYTQLDFHSCTKKNEEQYLTNLDSLPEDWKKLISIQSCLIQKNITSKTKILEIGCGEGLLLNELKKLNYQVYGIEPSLAAYKRALARGLEVKNGYYPEQSFPEKFEVVIMSHVLEHIENPSLILEHIKKTTPGGYLLLSQTNYQGLIPRIQKEKWYAWVPDQHFWHFTLKGLTLYLEKFGYSLIDYQYSSLVHPRDFLYKMASFRNNWVDQFTVLYKLNA